MPILKQAASWEFFAAIAIAALSTALATLPAQADNAAPPTYDPSNHTVILRGETSTKGTTTQPAKKQPTSKTQTQPKCRRTANTDPLCWLSPLPTPNITQIGAEAAASVTLPVNTPIFGPQPDQNQWNIIPVGYPIWLWTTDNQTSITQSVTNQGLTVALTATRQNINYNMGDGNHITCAKTTTRPVRNDPFQQSPTCGYTYQTTGTYTITATTTWNITWAVAGQTGTITITDNATAPPLPIAELHTVIVNNPPG